MFVISKSMLFFYFVVVKVKYINWGIDCYGKYKFYMLYCVNWFIVCILVFILFVIGYVKVLLIFFSIISGIMISFILVGFIILDSVWCLILLILVMFFVYLF